MAEPSILSVLNPLSDKPYAPKFFKPFGDTNAADKYNRKAFQVAALVPLYTLLGILARGAMAPRSEELRKLEKTAPIATSMTSTAMPSSLGEKKASDLLYQSTSSTIPILLMLTSLFGGMKIADRYQEKKLEKQYNDEINSLEKQYNKELAKRLYPNGGVKMPKAYKMASDIGVKEAGVAEDIIGALGIMQYLAPLSLAIALGTGYTAKKYFDANSEQRKKAASLRKSLEANARVNWVPKMELPEDEVTGEVTI